MTTIYDTYNKDHKYNSFNGLSEIPYKMLCVLMENNDIIFKLLKYSDEDPLSHPDLTIQEKTDLIYRGGKENPNDEGRRIFLIPKSTDGTIEQQSQMKIYLENVLPINNMDSICTFAVEVLSSLDIDLLDNGRVTRTAIMCEEILKTLNGCRFDGITNDMFFNNSTSRYNMLNHDIENNRNYHGYTMLFSCYVNMPKIK